MLALEFVKSYNVPLFTAISSIIQRSDIIFALHGPTALIIALFYAPRWVPLMPELPAKMHLFLRIMGYVIAANCVTVFCYLIIKYLSLALPLWIGFMITFFLLVSTRREQSALSCLQFHHFLLLGFVQGIAVLPGISRLAAVYATGYFIGLGSRKAFDVAWMLQFPLIAGASCFGWMYLVYQQESAILLSAPSLIAIVTGSVVALMGFYCMDLLAKKNKMWFMAWYIIIPLIFSFWYGS